MVPQRRLGQLCHRATYPSSMRINAKIHKFMRKIREFPAYAFIVRFIPAASRPESHAGKASYAYSLVPEASVCGTNRGLAGHSGASVPPLATLCLSQSPIGPEHGNFEHRLGGRGQECSSTILRMLLIVVVRALLTNSARLSGYAPECAVFAPSTRTRA